MKTVFSAFSSICEELIDASTTYQLALSHPRKVGFKTGIRYALQSEINGCNLGEGFEGEDLKEFSWGYVAGFNLGQEIKGRIELCLTDKQ